jgi:toxin FitB
LITRQGKSRVTLGEIRQGIAILPQSRKRTSLETWPDVEFKNRFAGRILPVDSTVADRWGRLNARAARRETLTIVDSLLAATALEHGLTIVTRNIRDFETLEVDVVNPWEA